MTITLRPATATDADLLFAWRNDPLTRQNSRAVESVPWETHLHWLSASLQSAARLLLIAESKGEPVGTVRLDHAADHCELSWTVSPKHRGRGLGAAMVAKAVLEAKAPYLVAKIRPGNVASRRIAESCGFRYTDTIDGYLVYRWSREPS